MHSTVIKINLIKNKIKELIEKKQLKTSEPKIIVVTKTFPLSKITPLLENGHIHFGENKVKEAEDKWKDIKSKYNNCKLHMIGKLQSNKAKKAVQLFDYIHSLDNAKLAEKISKYQKEINKKTKLFIQINVGQEKQKSGIIIDDLKPFYDYCIKQLSLDIVGLMILPPNEEDPEKYFELLQKTSKIMNLNELSMGMSNDYLKAIIHGATYVRLGTAILGDRNN